MLYLHLSALIISFILSFSSFANQKLLDATLKQDLKQVQEILRLDSSVDLEFKDKHGMTSLAHAAKLGNLRIFKTLWRTGASTEAIDKYGTPVAIHAYIQNHLDIFNILNRYDEYTKELSKRVDEVFAAAKSCDLEKFKDLQSQGVRLEFKNIQSKTVFQVGLEEDCKNIVRHILYTKVYTALHSLTFAEVIKSLNHLDYDHEEQRILLYVLRFEFAQIFTEEEVRVITNKLDISYHENHLWNILTDLNIDLNNRLNYIYPLFLAAERNHLKLVQALVRYGADVNIPAAPEIIRRAVQYSNLEMVKFLVEQGANINTLDIENSTLLFEKTTREVFQYLIAKGLDINHRNRDGETPLIHAVRSFSIDNVKNILEFGADVNIRDDRGRTALSNVFISYDIDDLERMKTMHLLIDAGADLNHLFYGNTFLMNLIEACSGRYVAGQMRSSTCYDHLPWLIKKVVDHPNVDFSINDAKGNSIFHYAILLHKPQFHPLPYSSPAKLVEGLLNKGLDINTRSGADESTPLMLAAYALDLDVVKILLQRGANTILVDKNGDDVLARMKNHKKNRHYTREGRKKHREIKRLIKKARQGKD
jgi:ankyrin repeat protein